MPSSSFESDYLYVKIKVTGLNDHVDDYIDKLNQLPEGSAFRLEMEALFLQYLSEYVAALARDVRDSGAVTLYDIS